MIGRIIGIFRSTNDVATLYQSDPTIFYLLGRTTSAVTGTTTVWMVYLTGKNLFGRLSGIIGAILLATAFIHVRDSHYAVTDVLISLLVLLCLYFSVRFLRNGRHLMLGCAGLAGGAAIGLKYLPAPIMIVPILSVLYVQTKGRVTISYRAAIISFGILILFTVAGFLIAFPALLISPTLFVTHVEQAFGQAANPLGNLLIDTAPAWLYYGQTLLWGIGVTLLAAAMGGVVLVIVRRNVEQTFFVIGIACYFAGICLVGTYFARYALPLVPPLMILAAGFLVFCSDFLFKRARGRVPGLLITSILVLGVIAFPTAASIRHDHLLTKTDTRTLAKEWIEVNLPDGSLVMTQWFGPPLSVENDPEPKSVKIFDVVTLEPFSTNALYYTIDHYRDISVDYIILNRHSSNVRMNDPATNGIRKQFYEALEDEVPVLARFDPSHRDNTLPFVFDEIYGPAINLWQRERPGPTVRIYQLSH